MMATTIQPRVYAACLAAYNNGILHGEWIDADQDADDIHAEIQAMLKRSPIKGAEEWAFHDHEYMGQISEYESVEHVSEIGQAIAEHGEAFIAFRNYEDADATADDFQERYQGEMSEEDFAEHYVSEFGWNGIPTHLEIPTGPYGQTKTVNVFEELGSAIDMDYIARELFQTDYYECDGYVFRRY